MMKRQSTMMKRWETLDLEMDDLHMATSKSNADSEMQELQQWLKSVDLAEYTELFVEQGFGDRFLDVLELQERDLETISKLAHRKRLSAEIRKLRERESEDVMKRFEC